MKSAVLALIAAASCLLGLCAAASVPAGTYVVTLPDRKCPKASGNLDGQTCSTRPDTVGLANGTLAQQKWRISVAADPRYRRVQNLSRRSCASRKSSWLVAPAKCGRAGARQLAVLSRSEGATAASDTLFEVVCSELDAAGYLPCYFKAKALTNCSNVLGASTDCNATTSVGFYKSGEAKSATLWRLYTEDMPRPMEGDVAYVGADVQAVLGVPSAAACKALCSAHAGCYFFTFSPSKSNTCFLKGKCGWRKQAQAGAISGPDLGSVPTTVPAC